MIFEGFLISLANTLGIPIGARIRKVNPETSKSLQAVNILDDPNIKDFINTIVDITKDDVCVGNAPMYFTSPRKRVSKQVRLTCDKVCKAFNKVASWVATDLLKVGVSVYIPKVKDDGRIVFTPFIEEFSVYLSPDMEVVVIDKDNNELQDALVFLYYDKEMLELVQDDSEDDRYKGYFRVNTAGIQTKNLTKAALDLIKCEAAISRLRAQTSRVIRFASVEVGLSKGDTQQQVVDDISEGLNANSSDLVATEDFDDQIPVYPTRKGLGKPEYEEHYSQADLKQLADLDYYLSKVFMAMRFPKSYADFTQSLSQTAVSMVRGDARYEKLVTTVRSIIQETFNDYMSSIKEVEEAEIVFKLIKLPGADDEDTTTVLSSYTDLAQAVEGYLSVAESKEEMIERLNSLRVLFASSVNDEFLERWYDTMLLVIEAKFAQPETDAQPQDEEGFNQPEAFDLGDEGGAPPQEGQEPPEEPAEGEEG